jgi:hypothetical protein
MLEKQFKVMGHYLQPEVPSQRINAPGGALIGLIFFT